MAVTCKLITSNRPSIDIILKTLYKLNLSSSRFWSEEEFKLELVNINGSRAFFILHSSTIPDAAMDINLRLIDRDALCRGIFFNTNQMYSVEVYKYLKNLGKFTQPYTTYLEDYSYLNSVISSYV